MSISEYILKNWTDDSFSKCFSIKGYNTRLKPLMEKNSQLSEDLKPILKDGQLSREKVFEWVKRDPYKGFLAAMLWGGISTATSKRKMESNAERAFSTEKKRVETILNSVAELLKEGKEGDAFDFLCSPKGKIDGIGVSYLTKIMYFFSPDDKKESLIFDKWGRFMHAAFLMEDKIAKVEDYYSYKKSKDYKSELVSVKSEKELYLDYLSKMRSIENNNIASAGHLEAFLFGKNLNKKNLNDSNPRYFLYNLVKSHFWENDAPQQSFTEMSEVTNPEKEEKAISALDSDQSIMKRSYIERCLVEYEGARFFIFVGKDKRKAYCEILSKNGKYLKEKELIKRGYVVRGGKNPYYIKLFDKNDIEEALAFMNETKRLYSFI